MKLLVDRKLHGENRDILAWLFHRGLADQICEAVRGSSETTGVRKVALSGGVFQNRLLLEMVEEDLVKMGFTVFRHHLVPPNDGGIALGQAVYGMEYLNNEK